MQWFDTVQSQHAKDIVEQKARWAAERWRRMKHEEQQEEKRKIEQEEIRKRMEEVVSGATIRDTLIGVLKPLSKTQTHVKATGPTKAPGLLPNPKERK